ncbi:hypothetical protein Barb4_01791 [Bacteroidales bacterium Barb4]|nr:hypothetical protein Barb4_01791 [Bacteroidales bacterium Barb4]
MNIKEFLNKKEFQDIDKRLNDVREEIKNDSFNLSAISSYTSHLENFHSDVIAELLDPHGRHKRSSAFLHLFIDYLNTFESQIKKSDFDNAEVTREKGKIDIWIKDADSKKSIIIENKINDAGDMEDQLERYHDYAISKGFVVECVIYLTLNGNKNAPIANNQDLNKFFLNVSAFSNKQQDLYHGWIIPCYEASKNNDDCFSFIYQYGKLLKYLSQMGLDREIKDDFYEIINQENGLKKAKAIFELTANLEEYRADLFMERIGDYAPFTKIYRYKPWHWLFERFTENGISYKLDVHFDNGSARMDFWEPDENLDREDIAEKLDSIGLLEDFEEDGFGNGMYKEFVLVEGKSIRDVDDKLTQYVQSFFEKLRKP